ncbi:tRNA pseudouridine(38-40) synthase TruA [Sphingorhabdus lutea]|uniref:tRNA pseudouridine synthase A n=1 Tax=Sphingorhabdus lutea TaxID=1913578 RepID=A0A1L3JBG7_9SPHN|nr:tRNA pseudouridine(38-40) synthase TruA [Sphingorhabdus lutea]APG62458.1 tRNA pseudouridine(38-40) synthase TruA [Sphingorhabdus lutea]
MTRFALTIEFDGRPYMGWQHQNHGPSVQQAIEEAIEAVTQEKVRIQAAGRTDSGVHALAMRAHADIEKPLSAFRLGEAINAKLKGHPIAIISCEQVADDWHARFSCIGRAYIYHIVNRRAPLTLQSGRAWQIAHPLDSDAMHDAAQILLGLHDFTTFRSTICQSKSPIKTLDQLDVVRSGDDIKIYAGARSFLHHQVRSMVGCLAAVGSGRWTKDDLQSALEAKDRQRLAINAPPDGLYFVKAIYPE